MTSRLTAVPRALRCFSTRSAAATAALALTTGSAFGQVLCPGGVNDAKFPMEFGEAAVTCFGGYNNPFDPGSGVNQAGYSLVVVDVRVPPVLTYAPPVPIPVLGTNWCAPRYYNEMPNPTLNPADVWNAKNLGAVFGVTLDGATPPNIFVSTTSTYGSLAQVPPGPGGSGAVYRIDGITGAICHYAALPNTGPALGNICYEAAFNNLFISNLDDGLIYVISAGNPPCLTRDATPVYDHGVQGRPNEALPALADDALQDFTQLGRRIWGVQVYQNRLYYSVWYEHTGAPSGNESNEIWSVGLDGVGMPDATTAQLEIVIPAWNATVYSNPVSSIAFSDQGKMLLAERTKYSDYGITFQDAHAARVLEYVLSGPSWVPSGNTFFNGEILPRNNAAGGADYDCDENEWNTGDALKFSNEVLYGLQWIPAGGNTFATAATGSYIVDLDGIGGSDDKTTNGDISLYRPPCACMEIVDVDVSCELNADGTTPGLTGCFTYTFTVTNNSGVDASYILIPSTEVSPNVMYFNPPISGAGGMQTVTVTLCPDADVDEFCFRIILADAFVEECCSTEQCVTLPDCDCLDFGTVTTHCEPNGDVSFTLTFTPLTSYTAEHMFLIPQPPGGGVTVTPSYINISVPPFTNGSVGPIIVSGAAPGEEVCILVTIHDLLLIDCCSEVVCFTIPDCTQPLMCPGDLDKDGDVDLSDLGIVLADFGCAAGPGNCPGDLDADGDTDLSDLGVLLAAFGQPCN